MLELIRKYSKSIVVKVFLTVLAASFLFFFAFPIIADKLMGKDYVVKIANMKISPQVFKYEKNKKLFDAGVIDIETYAIIIESINQMKEEELKQLDAVVREVYFSSSIKEEGGCQLWF